MFIEFIAILERKVEITGNGSARESPVGPRLPFTIVGLLFALDNGTVHRGSLASVVRGDGTIPRTVDFPGTVGEFDR